MTEISDGAESGLYTRPSVVRAGPQSEAAQHAPAVRADAADRAGSRPWWRRPAPAAVGVIACVLFFLCLAVAYSAQTNSDGAVFALAGWDLWHHNLLLHHWAMADASFITLEVPLDSLVEMVYGLGPQTMRITGVLTFLLVAVVAMALACSGTSGSRAWRRSAVALLSLSTPLCFGGITSLLLEMPNHLGTSAFILLAFLLYARFVDSRVAALAVCAVLAAGQIGDETVRYIGVTAIVLVAVVRAVNLRSLRVPDLRMALAAVASIPLAELLQAVMRHLGGYSLVPVNVQLAPLSAWPANTKGTTTSLLFLYNLWQLHLPGKHSAGMFIAAVAGALAVLAGLYGLGRTVLRWRQADTVDRLACLAVPLYLGSDTVSTVASPSYTHGYEFMGILPLFAVLAARNLPSVAARVRIEALVAAAAAGAVLLSGALQPTVVAPQERLAAWLRAHQLTHGLGSYWNAASVTVDSGDAVQVRAVQKTPHSFAIYAWHTRTTWYDPSKVNANFFIAEPGRPTMTVADVESVYGKPIKQYSVEGVYVLVYPFNLLDAFPRR